MIISAAIFDLNGTILSDEDEYGKAFARVLKQFDIDEVDDIPHIAGIGVEENWPKLIEKYGIKTEKTPLELAKETQEAYEDMIDEITLQDGIVEFINDLKESGVKVALATSNNWEIVDKVFEKFGFEGLFDAVTTGEEVEFKKPDPDIFILTSKKLDIDPENCLVFEDADAGVEAAHRAGMKVVGIVRKSCEESLEEADITIDSFKEMSPELIAEI